ncbi:UDP-N-acetylmuramoylalanine-D-glutamate ligase [Geomicrobium sp. JCM 19037]|uniref:UDP-N-acetylmuramoyl-L-alanine--D-glutamate ligase n=1 Tax=Geomicrobium sp. JCM 19037 TaxID=1460634 RepID=UPI00045F16F5|nr:UDP-N-acetylmuramoyl-L-alanine--D-glutamate ligase [Geomicrobium sp. JCM 19037]GAK04052.1 UDP-N-acetylmuramoylalanine-D-glutamate ligase [Geomicrobium sp. JCM 19037]
MNDFSVDGKKVVVLGLARSGEAAARLLYDLGASVTVNEYKEKQELQNAEELESLGISFVTGGHPLSLLEPRPLFVVKNPGIRYDNPLVKRAIEAEIPVITEIELAAQVVEGTMIAITGSNGKTTTTELITRMISEDGKQAEVAGNIGRPASEVARTIDKDGFMVTEVSSFQLKGTLHFKPKIALMLNIFDAHLDYHGTKEDYVNSKTRITTEQTEEDFFVYNADDPIVVRAAEKSRATKVPFSVERPLNSGAYYMNDNIYWQDTVIMKRADAALPGIHNLENILAAVAAAKLSGVSDRAIAHVLNVFTGVEHRLQYVKTLQGRKVFNDSKATNVLATEKALQAFKEPVVLIAGGLDRGNEFDGLMSSMENVKALISYGETKHKLKSTADAAGVQTTEVTNTLDEAVATAFRASNIGDVILLSPACASWDQYRTFEERGEAFIRAIGAIE